MKASSPGENKFKGWRVNDQHEREYNQAAMKCCQREQQVTSWRVNDLDEMARYSPTGEQNTRKYNPLGGMMKTVTIQRQWGIPE